jgi:flavorubredoxin
MTFAPLAPSTYVPPTEVATDTFVIHQVQPALGQPLFVYLNSMVIRGEEPVIVDTGTPANREQWLQDAFSLVEPKDVRWVFKWQSQQSVPVVSRWHQFTALGAGRLP